ncbi:MAG: rod shape-determining protein MreC, partial [Desulfatibacillaceae bacterium]|nr:rod shape-determining protein MreC [Desulfatibacillaceae bacterium]
MFSRKTATALLLIVLFVLFAVVLALFGGETPASHPLGSVVITAVAPFIHAATWLSSLSVNAWEHYFFLVDTSFQNARLEKELGQARQALHQNREADLENRRLRRLLGFPAQTPHVAVVAKVVGEDPTRWFKSIVIDRGKADGIKPGDPVVTPEGIVGRVAEVAWGYSLVLLVIDPNHAVDARISRTRARGVVVGAREAGCKMLYVLKKEDLVPGDTVITTGLDNSYPPGLVVGAVSSLDVQGEGMFKAVKVLPFVAFDKLEEVLVLTGVLPPPYRQAQ